MGRKNEEGGLNAAAAIAAALNKGSRVTPPSKKALKELEKLIEHNDIQANREHRVSKRTAIDVLQSHGWAGSTAEILDKVCREQLARKSFSTP